MKLLKVVKDNKGIYRYSSSKRRPKEIVALLPDVAEHPEKATLVVLLLTRCAIGAPRSLWVAAKSGRDKGLLTAEEELFRI